MNKLTKVAILALTAAGFASISAMAQNVSSGAQDLILGFQVTDGASPGATSNLEVDLGPASNFTTTTSLETLPQLTLADLTSVYGSSWATRGDLEFAIAGSTSASAVTFDKPLTTVLRWNHRICLAPITPLADCPAASIVRLRPPTARARVSCPRRKGTASRAKKMVQMVTGITSPRLA